MLASHRRQGIIKLHVGIERIVFRARLFLCDRIIKRSGHLCLVGKELSQLHVCRHAVCLVVILRTLGNAVFYSAETVGDDLSGSVDRADVRELDVESSLCCPSTLVVVFAQPQLVDPHLSRLDVSREVTHTYNHRLYLSKRRVSHYADLVVRIVFVVCAVDGRI